MTGNPLVALARQAGARTVVTDLDNSTMHTAAGAPATAAVEDAAQATANRLAAAVDAFAESSATDASLADVAAQALPSGSLSEAERSYLSFALNEYEHEYAGAASEISARFFDRDREVVGGDVLFPDGYAQLTDHLATGLTIVTGQAVTGIDWTGSGVVVTTEGQTHRGSHVVVTLPLGVLKSGEVRFGRELPPEKSAAVSALGVGLLDKCFLEFPEAFWDDTDWITRLPSAGDEGTWAQWVNLQRPTGKPVLLGFNAAGVTARVEKLSDEATSSTAPSTVRGAYESGLRAAGEVRAAL